MSRARLTALVAVVLVLVVLAARQWMRPKLGPGVALWDTELSRESFAGGDASGAVLWGTRLREADLSRATFTGARLGGADLQSARLEGTNFTGANLCLANLRDANLRNANLSGADLQGARLEGADLFQVTFNKKTRWPQGFRPLGANHPAPPVTGDTVRIRVNRVATTSTHLERKWTLSSDHQYPVTVLTWLGGQTTCAVDAETISELHVNAEYLDGQVCKTRGYSTPGLWCVWKDTTRQKSRYGSGIGQSASSLYEENHSLEPAAVPLDADLTVRVPAELPLVTIGGKTRILQLGSGFATMLPPGAQQVTMTYDLVRLQGLVLLAAVIGMLVLVGRLWRRRTRSIPPR